MEAAITEDDEVPPKKAKTEESKSEDNNTRPSLPNQLLLVLSNLYLNVVERLKLRFPPRCAEDLAFCHTRHYRAPLPEAPSHTQAENLRCTLQNQRYISFVNATRDMCHRREFPGDRIFTKLLELILSINPKKSTNNARVHLYERCVDLFSLIVSTFPPCWLAMRPFYESFFKRGLNTAKIAKDKELFPMSGQVFEAVLNMVDITLENCTAEQVRKGASETASKITPSEQMSPDANSSISNEFLNPWEWEEHENSLQTFQALDVEERLERLFVVLRLMLQILEMDFVMWNLHHHKKTKDLIFSAAYRPLAVLVFELKNYTRLSSVVRRIFKLFANAVSRELHETRLLIVERYIALLMVVSNTADMENTVIGVKYPVLGSETKDLILEYFKVFKAHNTSKVSTYVSTIDVLRIPFVRYEFIDHFLQLFYFARNDDVLPKKIAYDMAKKRWLKYVPAAQLDAAADDELSREQYLHLLLLALRAYCEWHGVQQLYQLCTHKKLVVPFRTTTDSVHRWPVQGSGGVLVLSKIAADMPQLEKQLKLSVCMSKPKVDLPLADICIDEEIIARYRNDLKHLVILNGILAKQSASHTDVDFSAWQQFLADFAPL